MTDLADLRARLEQAERALDDGDYTASVRESAEAYAALVVDRPDLVFGPPPIDELPIEGGHETGLGSPVGPWPDAQGVTVDVAEGRAPEIVLAKSRYTMSDAITYLEYTLELVKLAEGG